MYELKFIFKYYKYNFFLYVCSEDWYKDHPDFKVLFHDADGDGLKDFGDRRVFTQVNVNRKRP